MTCIILHFRNDSPKAQIVCTARAVISPTFQVINGLIMEYKFPTECYNVPTNLVLSAIYWQVVGAAESSALLKALGAVSGTEGKGQEAAGQDCHYQLLAPEGPVGALKGCCWHDRDKINTRTSYFGQQNSTTGTSYFKDVSALKMANLSSCLEVLLQDVFAHTHATNKPSNSRLYGSFLNTAQSVHRESHSPFLHKRPKCYREQSKNGIPPFLTMVTHRRQDGDPLVYHSTT